MACSLIPAWGSHVWTGEITTGACASPSVFPACRCLLLSIDINDAGSNAGSLHSSCQIDGQEGFSPASLRFAAAITRAILLASSKRWLDYD